MELVRCGDSATKNAGRENDGPSKSRVVKLQDMTRHSSADEITNVNFLRRHRTRTTKYKKKTKTNS